MFYNSICLTSQLFPFSQNILGWEEKSKQPITAFFDFANLPCHKGETLKGSVNTIIALYPKQKQGAGTRTHMFSRSSSTQFDISSGIAGKLLEHLC